jgi:hypothetical protein
MMQGIYRIYKDGKLVAEKENQMTVAGRSIVLKALMGLIPSIGGNIQVGISSTANQTADSNGLIPDTRLGFSVSSIPVRLAFLDNSGNYDAMVFRGTIPSSADAFTIYELGIFPSNPDEERAFSELSLVSGTSTDGWLNNGQPIGPVSGNPVETSGYVSTSPTGFTGGFRVGSTALYLKKDQTLRINKNFDQFTSSGQNAFNIEDFISIAYSKKNTETPKIILKFLYNDANYFSYEFTAASGHTYGFKDILRSAFSRFGPSTLGWGNINAIEIKAEVADVIIDAIRINDNLNVDTTYGMVSRTVLGSENVITKSASESLDIEYYLSFGFNKAV